MGNYYLLNARRGWACVCVSKNACTSLKKAALVDAGIAADDKAAIHDGIGYCDLSPFLRPVSSGKPPGYASFAVWRDPVERFLSTYVHFAIDRSYQRNFATVADLDLDGWIAYTESMLSGLPMDHDEHLRRQSDYYSPQDVDLILPIWALNRYFADQGWGQLARINASSCCYDASSSQRERIRRLYEQDYALVTSGLWTLRE